MRYTFQWDPGKAKLNLRKHKVGFERAAEVFLDPLAISLFDDEHSDEEERWITMGRDGHDVILVVIHAFREVKDDEGIIRIISARKATKNEVKQYEELA